MKTATPVSYMAHVALTAIAANLRRSRLARGDSQQLAAERCGVSLATYRRLESSDAAVSAAVSAGALLSALCAYGLERPVLALGEPQADADWDRLSQPARRRGRRAPSGKAVQR